MDKNFRELMIKESDRENLTLTDEQISQFFQYYEMMIEKNKVMNLTAITEMEDVIVKHYSIENRFSRAGDHSFRFFK